MSARVADRALWRRARVVRRRSVRRAGRAMALVLEALGEVGEVWRPTRRDDFGRGKGRPVLLLHGFGAPRRVMHVMERRLRGKLGVAVMSFHIPGFGGAFGGAGIPDEAARLAEKLERLCQRHGVQELDIIGHSQGGLVAHHMITHHPVGRRVKVFVALGTPFKGAPLAWLGALTLGWVSRSLWQLMPSSAFVKGMRASRVPGHIRVVSISGNVDLVAPASQCRLEESQGGPGQVRNVVVTGIGHNGLLMSRRVFGEICAELRPAPQVGQPAHP